MPNWFNRQLKLPRVRRSMFDMSNNFKTSTKLGVLTPLYLEECLPGDEFKKLSVDSYIRFAPLKLPVMHRINVHQWSFFVPIRIILGEQNYEDFLNNKKQITSVEAWLSTDEEGVNPFINSIFDYLGYDPDSATSTSAPAPFVWKLKLPNPIPYYSYLSIVRNWFIDEVLQETEAQIIDNLLDNYRFNFEQQTESIVVGSYDAFLWKVAYGKDYFNTARPTPQLGSEMLVLNSPLKFNGEKVITGYTDVYDEDIQKIGYAGPLFKGVDSSDTLTEGTTIRDLWRKEMLQRFFEVDNTFGTRIREKLAGHFGVRYPDERIMIPRIIGASRSTANIQEVVQTSASTATSPLGSFGGRSSAYDHNSHKPYTCLEHGYVLSLMSVVPVNGYVRGVQRTLLKQNFFDFASPEFNNIGWQDVYEGEIFSGNSTDTWAYQPRYSEYRSHPSRVAGNFRNSSELAWHLDRNFAELPPLNGDFIKVSDTERIFAGSGASATDMPLYVDSNIISMMYRPISYEPDSMHIY